MTSIVHQAVSTVATYTAAVTSYSTLFVLESNLTTPYNQSSGGYLSSTALDTLNTTFGFNNETVNPVFPSYIRTISMVFCILIMCLGVVGNVMVPIVIFRTKDMRNSTNIFLVNLSFADLMVLLVCTPTVLVEVNSRPETWVLGEEMCKFFSFFYILKLFEGYLKFKKKLI